MQFHLAFSGLVRHWQSREKFTDEELETLRPFFTLVEAGKKDQLIREGQVEHRVYFVVHGILRAYFIHEDEERTAAFVYDNYWSSSFGSFLSATPSPYTIECLTPATLLALNKESLYKAFDECRTFERYFRRLMESLIVGMQFRERELLASDAEERFKRFMNSSAFLVKDVPLKYIASYLNMTPETFSRMRRKWMETT